MSVAVAEGAKPAVGGARRWLAAAALLVVGVTAGMTETRFPSIVGDVHPSVDLIRLATGLFSLVVALAVGNTFWRLPWRQPSVAIALAFLGCLLAGWLGGVSWPSSADESAYIYHADTFAAGRLWNPAPADPSLFEQYRLLIKDGRMLSAYPPGWAAILLPFSLFRMTWLTNPLLTVALGVALEGACRQLGLSEAVRRPVLALVLLTPFTLFLGGSLFPQTLACALVASVVWAQLADESFPSRWRKLLIGALFGIMLLARPDVFAVVIFIFGIDRLGARRLGAIADGMWVVGGLLPFVIGFGVYNAAITGNPLQLPSTWGGPGLFDYSEGVGDTELVRSFCRGDVLLSGRPRSVRRPSCRGAGLARARVQGPPRQFPVLRFFFAGRGDLLRHHTLRGRSPVWAALLVLGLAFRGFDGRDGDGRRFRPPSPSGRTVSLTGSPPRPWYSRQARSAYCWSRHTPISRHDARSYRFSRPEAPAVVLLPTRKLVLWPWQSHKVTMYSLDFTRNDLDLNGPILYGRADVPDAVARSCRLKGREVYRWEPPGRLVREVCP